MTRIVAGTLGGRRIVVPRGDTTRPTSERVREALFSALESRNAITGARVVDLYAGSGALGLEALSRGAASVILVDSSRQAVEAARRNVKDLGLSRVSVVLSSVTRFLAGPPALAANLVFADPPYAAGEDDVAGMLTELAARWVDPGAVVVVERSARSPEPRWPEGLVRTDVRRYGETALWQAQWRPERVR
jgi:16S rRNA (guanine966-N2)-methyltransferase